MFNPWDDYGYRDPFTSKRYSIIKFPDNDLMFKDQVRFITYLNTGFLFIDYCFKSVLYTMDIELEKDVHMPTLLNKMLFPYEPCEIPFKPKKIIHPMAMILATCPVCKRAGVLDWIGAATKRFSGYCHELKQNYHNEMLEQSKCFHYADSESYTIHLLEMELEIRGIEERNLQGMYSPDLMSSREIQTLKFFGVELSLLEQYAYNYLDYKEKSKIEKGFYGKPDELYNLLKQVPKSRIDTINAMLIVKQVNPKTLDSSLYTICPNCNGDGVMPMREITQDEICFRTRSTIVGTINCPNLTMLDTITKMFNSLSNSRGVLANLKRVLEYDDMRGGMLRLQPGPYGPDMSSKRLLP
jgi:hypothetical protein